MGRDRYGIAVEDAPGSEAAAGGMSSRHIDRHARLQGLVDATQDPAIPSA
jgi:hypothetical protein